MVQISFSNSFFLGYYHLSLLLLLLLLLITLISLRSRSIDRLLMKWLKSVQFFSPETWTALSNLAAYRSDKSCVTFDSNSYLLHSQIHHEDNTRRWWWWQILLFVLFFDVVVVVDNNNNNNYNRRSSSRSERALRMPISHSIGRRRVRARPHLPLRLPSITTSITVCPSTVTRSDTQCAQRLQLENAALWAMERTCTRSICSDSVDEEKRHCSSWHVVDVCAADFRLGLPYAVTSERPARQEETNIKDELDQLQWWERQRWLIVDDITRSMYV